MTDMKRTFGRYSVLYKQKAGFILPFILLFSFFGCNNTEVPRELYGVWTTEDPKYTNCKMEITEDLIIFSKGVAHILLYSIKSIEDITPPSSKKEALYKIYYEDDDGYEYTLSLFYSHTDQGEVLQLQHQKQMFWHREDAS